MTLTASSTPARARVIDGTRVRGDALPVRDAVLAQLKTYEETQPRAPAPTRLGRAWARLKGEELAPRIRVSPIDDPSGARAPGVVLEGWKLGVQALLARLHEDMPETKALVRTEEPAFVHGGRTHVSLWVETRSPSLWSADPAEKAEAAAALLQGAACLDSQVLRHDVTREGTTIRADVSMRTPSSVSARMSEALSTLAAHGIRVNVTPKDARPRKAARTSFRPAPLEDLEHAKNLHAYVLAALHEVSAYEPTRVIDVQDTLRADDVPGLVVFLPHDPPVDAALASLRRDVRGFDRFGEVSRGKNIDGEAIVKLYPVVAGR